MSELAKATNRNRESLYKTLSEKGNPQLNSVRSILSKAWRVKRGDLEYYVEEL